MTYPRLSLPASLPLEYVLETSVAGVVIADAQQPDCPVVYVNPAFERLTGYSSAEVLGRNCRFLQGADLDQPGRQLVREALKNGEPVTAVLRNYRKDGSVFFNELTLSVVRDHIGAVTHVVGFQNDVTVREQALQEREQALRDREQALHDKELALQQMNSTLDRVTDAFAALDQDGNFTYVNAPAAAMAGRTREELLGRNFLKEFPAAQYTPIGEVILRANDAGEPQQMVGYAPVMQRWIDVTAYPNAAGVSVIARDVTAQQEAQNALRLSEERFAKVFSASPVGMLLTGVDDPVILDANLEFLALAGYTRDEVIGRTTLDLGLWANLEERKRARQLLFETGQVNRLPARMRARDGTVLDCVISFVKTEIAGVACALSLIRDVGDELLEQQTLKDSEQRYRQAALELQGQVRTISTLREIDQAMAHSLDLSAVLSLLLDGVRRELNADAATVLLLNPHTLEFECALSRGFSLPLTNQRPVKVGEPLAGRVALSGQLLSVPDIGDVHVPARWRNVLDREGLRAYLGVPVMVRGRVVGVIEVLHRQSAGVIPEAWRETLAAMASQAAVAVEKFRLDSQLEQRNLELRLAYDQTIEGWAGALDLRDRETQGHSRRVTEMTVALCARLGVEGEALVNVRRGALLHDIGKMAIPDAILLKPGPLTQEELVVMRRHPEWAVELLSSNEFLQDALDIPRYHHEKWDGSGYPYGLKALEIPLTARVFAVVDVFDALTNDRPYRAAWTREAAVAHLQAGAGSHFDPRVVAAFLNLFEERNPEE